MSIKSMILRIVLTSDWSYMPCLFQTVWSKCGDAFTSFIHVCAFIHVFLPAMLFPWLCQKVRKSFGGARFELRVGSECDEQGGDFKTAIQRYNFWAFYPQDVFQLPAGPMSLFWTQNYVAGEISLIFSVSPILLYECTWRPGSNWWHHVRTMPKKSEKSFWDTLFELKMQPN